MTERFIRSKVFAKIADGFIPLLSWLLITFPLWFSPFHPAIVAYFIIAFDLYFFYKSIRTTYFAAYSYKKILSLSKVSFAHKLKQSKKAKEIRHFIIIPNYKEHLHKLDETIHSIADNDLGSENLYLVLAFEKREIDASKKAETIYETFKSRFKDILICYHPLLPDEEAGKASNQTYAAKFVDSYVHTNGWDSQSILLTICDADSHMPKNYFSYLTYEYLRDDQRLYHFFWAPVLLYNNFWQLPTIVRMQATLSSIIRLAFLSEKDKLIQTSTYSTNLWLLKKIHFWDVDIIPEDWHIYFQAFFTFGDRVKTIPLYTIINGDAVYSGRLIKTLLNRYEQEKRWAWGVSDIGYTIKKFFSSPDISITSKLRKILFVAETHLFWPTSFFILTVSASIPPLINPVFKRTVLGFLLPNLSGLILTLSSLLLILYMYLDIKLRKKVKLETSLKSLPLLFVQWYLLPFVSFLFSSLPALEAHTRILLGKPIKYKVTEKV